MKMKLTRRHTLTLALSAALAPLSNMAAHAQDQSKPEFIVVNASGGEDEVILREAYWNDFERDHGIKVIVDAPENFGKMRAMVESGNVTWALANLDSNDALRASRMNLLEEIDPAIVDRSEFLEGYNDPYAFANSIYSVVFAYHKDAFPDGGIKSWADFWDVEKFPGARAMRNSPSDNLEAALMADGVDPKDLYPLDVDRAFRKLDEIYPHVAVWWTTAPQQAQLLLQKEVVATTGWSTRLYNAIKNGAPIAMEYNQGLMQFGAYAIPKGSKDGHWGQVLLSYHAKPENQAKFSTALATGGTHKRASEFTDPALTPYLPSAPENVGRQVRVDLEWWADHAAEVQERWNKWMLSKS